MNCGSAGEICCHPGILPGRAVTIRAAAASGQVAWSTLAADTVSVIACPVDYSENLRLTDTLGELTGPF